MPPFRQPTPNLKAPRLRFSRPRDGHSRALDDATTKALGEPVSMPAYEPWAGFLDALDMRQGDAITIVGSTGSGKTTLALRLLPFRDYVCVLGTKNKDESLYPLLEREGYVITDKPELDPKQEPRVLFRPRLSGPTVEAQLEQRQKFFELLVGVFNEGGWCLYGDEIRYLSDNLKLKSVLELLWLQGRSLGITMIVSTQRPVSIPVVSFESAVHLFLFRTTDKANIDRAAEFYSADVAMLRYLLPRLGKYEVLYVNARTGRMARTIVKL
jgi:hypothetical protein